MIGYDVIEDTIIGSVCVAAGDSGVCAVFIADRRDGHARRLRAMFPDNTVIESPERVADQRRELEEYFAGERQVFSGPFDFAAIHGDFQRLVLKRLGQVPFGELLTYGQLAAAVGSPGAAQAVGAAMKANPIPIILPCHRVVASNGLGGYSGGGLANKRALLKHEGVSPPELF